MSYVAPPKERALSSKKEEQRQSLSIVMRENPTRNASSTVSAAAEARHIARAESHAEAVLARLGAKFSPMQDGGNLVTIERTRRRCSDMHAVQLFIGELLAIKEA